MDEIREIFDEDIGYCTRLLRHFLTLGNALLIFDGLDEILEIDRRREVVALIERFTSKYAACSSIVTSNLWILGRAAVGKFLCLSPCYLR